MTIEERKEYIKNNEGKLSLGIKKLLSFGLAGESEHKELEQFKHLLEINEQLAWKSRTYEHIKLRIANKEIVRAWLECKKNSARGVQLNIAGDTNSENGFFIVNLDNMPLRESDSDLVVTGIQVTGAKLKGEGTLKKGAKLKRFSGLSEIFRREESAAVSISVTFDKAKTVSVSRPAIAPPKAPKETIKITRAISAYGGWKRVRGDTEMDTDGKDRVPVECNTTLAIQNGKVVVSIYFYCEEDGGNHTTFKDTREFDVYSAPKGKKIIAISAQGGNAHRFTSSTRGRNWGFNEFGGINGTYWDKLDFRVDGKGRDDDTRVGVGGRLTVDVTVTPNNAGQ